VGRWSASILPPSLRRREGKERERGVGQKRRTKKIEPITVNNPGPLDPIFEPSEELVALIRADEKNSRRWDECLEKELRKYKWYKHVEEEFSCTGCQLVLCKPVTMPCGHSACLACLKKYHKSKIESAETNKKVVRDCWDCRLDLEEAEYQEFLNEPLRQALKFIFTNYESERDGSSKQPAQKKSPKREVVSKRGSRSRPGPKESSPEPEDVTEPPKAAPKKGSRSRPGPKSSKEATPEPMEETEPVEETEASTSNGYKPGPKSSKPGPKSSKPGPKSSKPGPKSSKLGNKPGPKSKKRKRDDSDVEDEDDLDEQEAKKPKTLSARQKKLLGEFVEENE